MPNDKIRNPGGPSLASRLNAQSRAGTSGYRKTNEDEVRLFKQRVRDGMDPQAAREGTKITKRMVPDILAGRTWAMVLLLLAICTMGSDCDGGGRGANGVDEDRRACWSFDYPLCSEVSSTYPCLCVAGASAVTSYSDELELYNSEPTSGYLFEGGPEGGETGELF